MRSLVIFSLSFVFALTTVQQCCAFVLVKNGQSKCDIVCVSSNAAVKNSADILGEYLKKITNTDFNIVTGDGATGLAVGTVKDFPLLGYTPCQPEFECDQGYYIKSNPKGIHIIGQSPKAVEFAVWDFLYRLGYRQYFPNDLWEIIPNKSDIDIMIDIHESPDFITRVFWPGFGFWRETQDTQEFELWLKKNRMNHPKDPDTLFWGHIYNVILKDNMSVFEAHPEYLALVEGKRELRLESATQKFCLSNAEVQKIIINWSINYFARNPDSKSLTMEPSDGGDWCQCDNCQAMGTPGDRATFIANIVADEVNKKYGQRYITLYAYNEHAVPPKDKLHRQVIPGIATAFIPKGYDFTQMFNEWSEKSSQLGIREYLDVLPWSRDFPGEITSGIYKAFRARGGDLDYIKRTIPMFYQGGARFYNSEIGNNWLPNGLGYYVAARLLWDVTEADNVDAIVDDFLQNAFAEASKPMAKYFDLLYYQHGVSEHDYKVIPRKGTKLNDMLLRSLYQYAIQAWNDTKDPKAKERLLRVLLYNKYVELHMDYLTSEPDTRQEKFEKMIRFTYQLRYTNMIGTLAIYRDCIKRDSSLKMADECQWDVPENENPWKNSKVFTETDIIEIVREAQNRYNLKN